MASITYSDDQYADNAGTGNAAECTLAQNNTSAHGTAVGGLGQNWVLGVVT